MVLQATWMSNRDSVKFYLMRPETLSSWAESYMKQLPKPALSDGQKPVVILYIRAVPTQGAQKKVVFCNTNSVRVFFAWSVLRFWE